MNGGLARIIVFARDVTRMAAFYRDHLGCEVIGEIDPEWTELRAGGCNIALHVARGKGGGAGNMKLSFTSDDVAAERDRLRAEGVDMGALQTFGDLDFVDGTDPEGNRFQISNRALG